MRGLAAEAAPKGCAVAPPRSPPARAAETSPADALLRTPKTVESEAGSQNGRPVFSENWWAGGTLVAQHRRHGRREAPSTKGTPFRAEDRVRHGCIAFNAGLCCTCAVTGAVGACAGCSSDAPRRYAPATYSVGESATRRRPVFLNSLRGVICWLTVGVRGAGNVGLRGGGAHLLPSWYPLHVRADHRWHDWACQYTPALLPRLPPAILLVCDEG